MKNLFSRLAILALSIFFLSCSDDHDERRISYSKVPDTVKGFLTKHFTDFSEADILSIERDRQGIYDFIFRSRITIDFYPNGAWKEIDLNGNPLPNSIAMLLPENALSYISSMYPGRAIEEIEKKGNYSDDGQHFKIELNNGREIYFDARGNVLNDQGDESGGKETVKLDHLPPPAQEFLKTYFKDQTPGRIEKEWNKYEVVYNKDRSNETEIEFFAQDGSFKRIEADNGNEIIRTIIRGITNTTAILDYLDKNHAGQAMDEFCVVASGMTIEKGYVAAIDGKPDYKIYFDLTGRHIQTVRD